MAVELLVLLVLILINGFFSMSEMAVVSSRKARLRHEADNGRKNYKQALETASGNDREAVREAFSKIASFDGVTGRIAFKGGAHDPVKSVVIKQFKAGKITFVTNIDPD